MIGRTGAALPAGYHSLATSWPGRCSKRALASQIPMASSGASALSKQGTHAGFPDFLIQRVSTVALNKYGVLSPNGN